jgi:hypothetical protein
MSTMQPSTASRPATVNTCLTQTGGATGERDRPPQIRSLITPGVASGPILPAWLRKRFQRRHTHT